MDWLTAVVELTKALAWPVVAGYVLWKYGPDLLKFLRSARTVKGWGIEMVRDKVESAELSVNPTPAPLPEGVAAPPALPEAVQTTSTVLHWPSVSYMRHDPASSVRPSYANVTKALRALVRYYKLDPGPVVTTDTVLNELVRRKLISDETAEAVRVMHRVSMGGAQAVRSSADALDFNASARTLVDRLLSALPADARPQHRTVELASLL